MAESIINKVQQFLWPKEAQKRALAKKYYKAISLFVVSTAVLMKYGKPIADQVYNQAMLEETIKASLN